jgi:hypothetical protein
MRLLSEMIFRVGDGVAVPSPTTPRIDLASVAAAVAPHLEVRRYDGRPAVDVARAILREIVPEETARLDTEAPAYIEARLAAELDVLVRRGELTRDMRDRDAVTVFSSTSRRSRFESAAHTAPSPSGIARAAAFAPRADAAHEMSLELRLDGRSMTPAERERYRFKPGGR